MGLRARRDRRQARRSEAPVPKRYQMRQKLLAFGDDFYIEDERGNRVFKVDGKVLRVRDTFVIRDMHGNKMCQIQERLLRVKDTLEIEGPDGRTLATVKKALITPVRDRWTVRIRDGADLEVQGNILDHEYSIGEGRYLVGHVSKRWFRVLDTYGVEVAPGQDDVLILAITVAIDAMA